MATATKETKEEYTLVLSKEEASALASFIYTAAYDDPANATVLNGIANSLYDAANADLDI